MDRPAYKRTCRSGRNRQQRGHEECGACCWDWVGVKADVGRWASRRRGGIGASISSQRQVEDGVIDSAFIDDQAVIVPPSSR